MNIKKILGRAVLVAGLVTATTVPQIASADCQGASGTVPNSLRTDCTAYETSCGDSDFRSCGWWGYGPAGIRYPFYLWNGSGGCGDFDQNSGSDCGWSNGWGCGWGCGWNGDWNQGSGNGNGGCGSDDGSLNGGGSDCGGNGSEGVGPDDGDGNGSGSEGVGPDDGDGNGSEGVGPDDGDGNGSEGVGPDGDGNGSEGVGPDGDNGNNDDSDDNDGWNDDDTSGGAVSAYAAEVADLVNQERAENGLNALSYDGALGKLAQMKAEDMAENNYFSHQSPTYGSAFDMMKEYGVSYRSAGENIARGQKTPSSVMDSWMNSSGHRANILSSSYSSIGVGYAVADDGRAYWVQIFKG